MKDAFEASALGVVTCSLPNLIEITVLKEVVASSDAESYNRPYDQIPPLLDH